MKVKKYLIRAVFIVLFFSSCDSSYFSSVPDTPVYLELVLNLEAQELRTVGGCMTFTTDDAAFNPLSDRLGYAGLIVIYGYDMNYYAYDMCCPHELNQKVRVHYDDAGNAVCDSCKSVYSIAWGSGACASGPAKEGLRKYQVIASNTASGVVLKVIR